jgi:hypothetical protein
MKPKSTSAYDVEPRTGKPFSSIKISQQKTFLPKLNVNEDIQRLDAQVPYTNVKKEFGANDWEIQHTVIQEENYNPMEEHNTNNLEGNTKSKKGIGL